MGSRGGGGGGGGGGRSVSGHQPHHGNDAAAVAEANEVTEGLRELLAHLEPLIKSSGSFANLSGMLGYLEENDDEFKRYQFVEWVRNHLEASVRALVEEEVRLQCRKTELTPHKMKMVAPAILHKVLQSAEMKDCLARMQMQVTDASWEMARDIESEYVKISVESLKMGRVTGAFPGGGGDGLMLGATAASVFGGGDGGDFNANQENHFRVGSSASRPFYDRTDSGNDSLGSSWNNSNFVFLQPHQYARLAERLNKFGPPDDKLEALGTLLSTQLVDVVGSPSWSSVCEGLQAAVLDQNLNVSSVGRRVYSRLVSNISPFATKEAFVSLLGSVTSVYADKTRAHLLPTAASGVLFKKKFHQNLVQAVKLISQVACDLPKYWTRYPEKYVDQMALAFVNFLNHSVVGGGVGAGIGKSKSTQQAPLSPVQLLSLVDNRARWLKHWLHGNLGRSRFFRHLEALSGAGRVGCGDCREFPGNLARAVVAVLEHRPVEEWTLTRSSFRNSAKGKGSVSDTLINYGFFLHSVRVICSMLGYERGSRLIPNGEHIVNAMVQFVSHSDHVSTRGPARAVASCLTYLARARPDRWFLDKGTLGKLVQPLRVWCRVAELEDDLRQSQVSLGQLRTIAPFVLENVVAVLCELLESPKVVKSLARDGEADALNRLISFVTLAFERHQSYDCAFLLSALNLAEKLSKTHLAPLSPKYTEMVHTLAEVSLELKDTAVTPTASGALGHRQKEELEQNSVLADKLKRTLVGFLSSPKSCLSLMDACEKIRREDGEDVLAHVAKGELSSMSEERDAFPLLPLFRPGLGLLGEQRFAERRLLAMLEVFTLEGDNKHWRPSPQEAEQRMLRSTALFSSLLSSFDLLTEALDGDDPHYTMLRELLLFNSSPFPNYSEGESVFALKILSCVLGSLDALVHMEAVHRITGKLMGEIKTSGGGRVTVDREALYIHHICQSARAIGGAGERVLPTLSFEERDSWDLRWDDGVNIGSGPNVPKPIASTLACPLSLFMNKTKDIVPDAESLKEARKHLRRSISSGAFGTQTLGERGSLLHEVVAMFHSALDHVAEEAMPPREIDLESERLVEEGGSSLGSDSAESSRAVKMLVNYGKSCLGIPLGPASEQDLMGVINRRSKGRHLRRVKFCGFEWFIGVAFLLCEGDVERCDSLLSRLSDCAASVYLWPSTGTPKGEYDPAAALVHVGHHVEMVLEEDVGLVYSALRSEGISAALVCRRWTSQCFLNFLPVGEICSYATLVALHGPDYVVFSCVAAFKHLEEAILDAVAAQLEHGRYVVEVLMSAQIEGFSFAKSLEFIEKLERKHGSAIKTDLIRVARAHKLPFQHMQL